MNYLDRREVGMYSLLKKLTENKEKYQNAVETITADICALITEYQQNTDKDNFKENYKNLIAHLENIFNNNIDNNLKTFILIFKELNNRNLAYLIKPYINLKRVKISKQWFDKFEKPQLEIRIRRIDTNNLSEGKLHETVEEITNLNLLAKSYLSLFENFLFKEKMPEDLNLSLHQDTIYLKDIIEKISVHLKNLLPLIKESQKIIAQEISRNKGQRKINELLKSLITDLNTDINDFDAKNFDYKLNNFNQLLYNVLYINNRETLKRMGEQLSKLDITKTPPAIYKKEKQKIIDQLDPVINTISIMLYFTKQIKQAIDQKKSEMAKHGHSFNIQYIKDLELRENWLWKQLTIIDNFVMFCL